MNKYPKIRGLVPIQPRTVEFNYGSYKSSVKIERKQFPLILAEAMTVHKAQGSGFDYMMADIDQTSKSGKKGRAPINPGMMYTLLSRAKCRNHLKLLNFTDRSQIKINKAALDEMRRMRLETLLSYKHPIEKSKGNSICLFNIRSWDLHLHHFLSDHFLAAYSSVLLFTETRTANCSSTVKEISDYCVGWKNIHHCSGHGLAICYDTSKVKDVERIPTWGTIECLAVAMTIDYQRVLFVLIYRPQSQSPNTFSQSLIIELDHIQSQMANDNYRTIVAGDFNLPGNTNVLDEIFPPSSYHQRSKYSTHIHGGILDLVFDDKKSEPVDWVPSPFSDHFVIIFD